jgi:hypothetical protein
MSRFISLSSTRSILATGGVGVGDPMMPAGEFLAIVGRVSAKVEEKRMKHEKSK